VTEQYKNKSKKGHSGRAGKPKLKLVLGQLVGVTCEGHWPWGYGRMSNRSMYKDSIRWLGRSGNNVVTFLEVSLLKKYVYFISIVLIRGKQINMHKA
jgi:hypothetical protein